MTLSPEERDALRTKVSRWISAMCNGDVRWRMCIPVDPDDSDVMLSALVEDHARLEADHARLTVALQAATEDSARLDWLEHGGFTAFRSSQGRGANVADCRDIANVNYRRWDADTIREAIDAARLPTEDTKR